MLGKEPMGCENLYIAPRGNNSSVDFCSLERIGNVAADYLINHNFGIMAMDLKKSCKYMDRT